MARSSLGGFWIGNIKITVSQEQFNKKISQLIEEVDRCLNQKLVDSSLIDIRTLTNAVKKAHELKSLDPINKEIPRLINGIDDSLHLYEQTLFEWLDRNMKVARLKINQIHPRLYDIIFYNLIGNLSYNEIKNMDELKLQYLIILCNEAIVNSHYNSENDTGLKILLLKLKGSTLTLLKRISASINIDDVVSKGNSYISIGRYEESIKFYNKALETDPQNAAFGLRGALFSAC